MEMEKFYYVITHKASYLDLLSAHAPAERLAAPEETEETVIQRSVVAITQGGFGQDVVDDERQVKERFLENLFSSSGIDLPRSSEVFDLYFLLERAGEFIDLDES